MILEDQFICLDEISTELIKRLPHELSAPATLHKPWTKAIIDTLREMGRERKLQVCCHGSTDQGEWLLDLVWMNRDDWRIVLAVESEWGKLAPIEEDFGKLMSIKARCKLLLFTTKNQERADEIVRRIELNMHNYPYHLVGEEYMALVRTSARALRYRFQVPHDGRLDSVVFAQMGVSLSWPWAG